MPLFNRIRLADPDSVSFTMVDGQPCFYRYIAFPHKNEDGKDEFSEKQLRMIAKHFFEVDQFNKWNPEKKGMWQLLEPDGEGRGWVLRFCPFVGSDEEHRCINLKRVLQHLGEQK